MEIAAGVPRTVLVSAHDSDELFHGFIVGRAALLGGGQFGVTQDAGPGIATGPRDQGRRACPEEVDPGEGTVLLY
jgi:hypothetical protein